MEIQENVSLARHTTFGVGGNTQWFIRITSRDDLPPLLEFVRTHDLPFFILGGGSNVLASDHFFEGIVIKIQSNDMMISSSGVWADAGVPFALLAKETAQKGLSGLEWGFGIPGTVGGAVRGNAGCFGHDMSECVTHVEVFNMQTGTFEILPTETLAYAYRKSFFHEHPHLVIARAYFSLIPQSMDICMDNLKKYYEIKRQTQPLGVHCAGSIFRNPELNGLHADISIPVEWLSVGRAPAGFLIENVNMKGHCIGGATVSLKHANFIVQNSEGTSANIKELIEYIKQRVHEKFGVTLEEEIQYIK